MDQNHITVDDIIALHPCEDAYPRERVEELFGGREFVTLADILDSDIPDEDKLWVALHENAAFFTGAEVRLMACDFAERVLGIYEASYPDDERPRKAIETARRYARGKASEKELDAAANAAANAARAAEAGAWSASWSARVISRNAEATTRSIWLDAPGAAAWASVWAVERGWKNVGDAAWASLWAAVARAAPDKDAVRDAERSAQVGIVKGYLSQNHITVDGVMACWPCKDNYPRERVEELFGGREFVTLVDILDMDIPDQDKIWAVCYLGLLADTQLRLIACDFAERALPVYEDEYPDDARPRRAIAVARKFACGEATVRELGKAYADASRAVWFAAEAGVGAYAAYAAARAARFAAAEDAANAMWAVSRAASCEVPDAAQVQIIKGYLT